MKPKIIQSILAAALLAPGALFAQTTATTTPVGYVSLGDTTSGQPAIKANTDVYVSIPLDRPTLFAGTVASVSGSTITISGTPGFGSFTAVPSTVKITSGAKNGLIGLITANTSNTITITPANSNDLSGIVAGDTIKLTEAWTVKNFMGVSLPTGTQLFTFPETSGLNPASELIFEWDGTNWIDLLVTGEAADDYVLYPTETLVIRNASANPINSIVITGEVSTSNQRSRIGASSSDNAVSYMSPVGEAIGTSGLSAIASPGDQILGFDNNAAGQNKAASTILEWDGTNWIDLLVTGEADDAFPLGFGRGFFYRRVAGGAATWNDTPNFVPAP